MSLLSAPRGRGAVATVLVPLRGDGQGFLTCNDSICTSGGAYWCGDGECSGAKTPCSCGVRCGAPPSVETSCVDDLDEDCDGLADCDDGDCASDAASLCLPRNASCSSGAECCSGVCRSRGKKHVCG